MAEAALDALVVLVASPVEQGAERRHRVLLREHVEERRAASLVELDHDPDEVGVERRKQLGGSLPERRVQPKTLTLPGDEVYAPLSKGSHAPIATTMALVRLFRDLMKDPEIGHRIVPIAPDELSTCSRAGESRSISRTAPSAAAAGSLRETVLISAMASLIRVAAVEEDFQVKELGRIRVGNSHL